VKSTDKPSLRTCDATEEELALVAEGKMRLPKAALKIRHLLKIPTGKVAGSQAVQALLDERDEAL